MQRHARTDSRTLTIKRMHTQTCRQTDIIAWTVVRAKVVAENPLQENGVYGRISRKVCEDGLNSCRDEGSSN